MSQTLYLPYGSSIVESFYKPAIVKPQNIMPVKVIKDIDINEAFAAIATDWLLCRFTSGEQRWMSRLNSEIIKYKHDVVKAYTPPRFAREIDTTVHLMKLAPGTQVIWGTLPGDMLKPLGKYINAPSR
jgi:hypothetical protein